MAQPIKILHISPDFDYSCGVSRYLTLIFSQLTASRHTELHFITNRGDALERISGLDLKISLVQFSKGLRKILHFNTFTKYLKHYIRNNHIEIVHTHHRFPEYIVNRIKMECGISTITTAHSITKGYKKISFHSDLIIAVSQAVKNHLRAKYKIPENRIVQLYNPVSIEEPNWSCKTAKEKLSIQENKKVILFIGTISHGKGFDILIEAFRKVSSKLNNCVLLVAGKWKDYGREAFISTSNIKTLDSQSEVSPLYAAADLVVLPSRNDSFPYTMLEAGLYSKPFIGSNVDGIGEFITDGVDGLLFKVNSAENLAEKIIYILSNPAKASEMGINLNKKVLPLTDIKSYCDNLRNMYTSLVKQDV